MTDLTHLSLYFKHLCRESLPSFGEHSSLAESINRVLRGPRICKQLEKTALLLKLPNFRRKLPTLSRKAAELFPLYDYELKLMFTDSHVDTRRKYEYLFRYLLTGFWSYQSAIPSLVNYYGLASWYDARVQAMEGFTRFLPLICAWLSAGHSSQVALLNGEVIDLEEIIHGGLLAGTDPASEGYWGEMTNCDQRICESAFLALSYRLMPDSIWKRFSPTEKKQMVDYILKSNGKIITDNNWNMFPVWINKVAASLGFEHEEEEVQTHFDRIKSFYRGEGWFTDGQPQGKDRFDYYNVFIFHFFLHWLMVFEPEFEGKFIKAAVGRFLETYPYLLTPAGVPFRGRSIPYRMALAAPVIAGCRLDPPLIPPGQARRAFDTLMTHFITRGAIARGTVTQGYYQEDLRWLDVYIGPASSLLSLAGLALALSIPFDEPFWTDPELPLPVEQGDFRLAIPSIDWEILGFQGNREVIIRVGNNNQKQIPIANYTMLHWLAEKLLRKPFRPQNWATKYDMEYYTSRNPVWSYQ